jgi:predicted TIM-barrel fold metal-dependent hydrolase
MSTLEQLGMATSWGPGDSVRPGELLIPDPKPRPRHRVIISVDDHLVEPGDLFCSRFPAGLQDGCPRVVEEEDGRQYWLIEGGLEPNVGANAAAGRSPSAPLGGVSVRFDEMRRGTWDIHERIRDMDLNGIHASLGFPSMVFGFCGQRFLRMRDPKIGLRCVRAYNDWVVDEWAAPYPDRIIPSQLTWLGDSEIAAEEIRHNAARGFKAVSFSENPEKLGLPSIHTGYWDRFLRACEETETVVNLHVGSSSHVTYPSSDGPLDTMAALFAVNAMSAAVDWVFSKIALRFPNIKIALSEGGIGWVPMILDRLDYMFAHPRTETWKGEAMSPADVLSRNFWYASFWDPSMFVLRDRIGVDHIMVEADYPHVDSTWPDTQAAIEHALAGVAIEDARKIAYENAARLYRHPLPSGARSTEQQ